MWAGRTFEQVARDIGADISEYSLAEHNRVIKSAIGVSPVSSEPWLASKEAEFVRDNANLITNLENETARDIERIVRDGIRAGESTPSIQAKIIQKVGIGTLEKSPLKMSAANRARLIARDQTAKFYGELNKLRQQNIGLTWYVWRTSLDERVRADHSALEGMLCDWDDDSIYSDDGGETWQSRTSGMYDGIPGSDYSCRCYSEPYFDNIL